MTGHSGSSDTDRAAALRRARRWAALTWAALILLQVIWHAPWLAADRASWPLLALTVVPLLLPGLALRRPARALLWCGALALLYFCHGVVELWAGPGPRLLAALEALLCTAFVLLLLPALPKRRAGQAPHTEPPQATR